MKIQTLAIHAAKAPDPTTGSVAQPIHLSTTFARGADGELTGPYEYGRAGNPNRSGLEAAAAQLEGGAEAFAFSSGQAAVAAVLQTVPPGDHILVPEDVYHGTRALIDEMVLRGISADYVDMTLFEQVESALTDRTRLILVETPSNPMLRITDIAAITSLAQARGARVAVDNTWPTPVLQRPLALGADFSLHSSTKYFGGHSDVLGGIVVAREGGQAAEAFRRAQRVLGAVPSPFDCWLLRRGLMTLPLRILTQTETAGKIASYLAQRSEVARVHYPGLDSHPGHSIAKSQMTGFGAMLSFELAGGEAAAAKVCSHLKLFTRATSLGAVESLVEHRYRVEGPHSRTPRSLLRVSTGLEHADDLLEDLDQALRGAGRD